MHDVIHPEEVTADQRSLRTLRSLRAGDRGTVTAVYDGRASTRRLAEFGMVRGTQVEMIRHGAPCIVRLDNTRLCLGAALQDSVLLSPL